ncbi:sulfatase-like hydrolase/transferase [Halorubrum sp. LN27]|uniref:sulfatase-like hydrolase/transferase n=1 Tax=Halorubrum sp. LN27 TaxID=2801032 RepID=UPI001909DF0F|nr:sulfatase-like hydrolase/transferase [Halorubrum sp. LN27]
MTDDGNTTPPNILLVVWDACRYDYALEHAEFLNELAATNIRFENAIAPSPWSLPSHASIFSGEKPHQHGSTKFGDLIEAPLVQELSSHGYRTYGVSANGFASQRTGFHQNFDHFRYTGGRDPFVGGLDVSGISQDVLRKEDASYQDALIQILQEIPRHDHPFKSVLNLLGVACGELSNKFEILQNIRHPVFGPTSDYSYNPQKNTDLIESIIQNDSVNDPFFLFTNYMDTHRCYKPSPALQKKHLGRTLEYNELVRLNEEIASPMEFESRKSTNTLSEEDIRAVRGLYAGEVETADNHLAEIFNQLEKENLRQNTIVIVTADHGENLGETDEMGRQRMGHEASVSDAVLRVPLVVAHPDLDAAMIENEVSLEFLYDLFLSIAGDGTSIERAIRNAIPDSPATSEYPATGGEGKTLKKYPKVSQDVVRNRSVEDSTVAYADGWKVVAESDSGKWAFERGAPIDLDDAPQELVEETMDLLEMLVSSASAQELDEERVSQLEDLGYI